MAESAADGVGGSGDGDGVIGDSLGSCADFAAGLLPALIVSLIDADEGVSDFVKDGVADFVVVIEPDEVPGELDGAFDTGFAVRSGSIFFLSEAELPFAVAPGKSPAFLPDAVLFHELLCESGCFTVSHPCLVSRSVGGVWG